MSVNADMIVNELSSLLNSFTAHLDTHVDSMREQANRTKVAVESARDKIRTFKEEMVADEQLHSAHENVLRLEQVIREKYAHNIRVRKTILDIVQDYDINLCRRTNPEKLSEELWLSDSRYWLSFALIAISAWVHDSRALADSALSEAVRMQTIKSDLFFCLANLRFGRVDAAKKWLTAYLAAVLPDEMKEETFDLLQAYINGVFGAAPDLEHSVQSIVDEWVRSVNIDDELTADLVVEFDEYIRSIDVHETFSCPTLEKYCATVEDMRAPYVESFKYERLFRLLEPLDVTLITRNAAEHMKRINAIMSGLITEFDADEQDVKDQRDYYQLILDNNGDVEIAEQQYEERLQERNRTENVGRKFVNWALRKDGADVDLHVRKFAFRNAREWFLTALDRWSASFESTFPGTFRIQLEDYTFESNGHDKEEQERNYKAHLEDNKYRRMYLNNLNIGLLIGAVLSLVAACVMLGIMPYVGYALFGVTAVLAVVIGIRCGLAGRKFHKMVEEKMAVLTACMTELTTIRATYESNIQNKNKLYDLIERL